MAILGTALLIVFLLIPKAPEYPVVLGYESISADTLLINLDRAVHESSGLLYIDGRLWTFNDSGNKPVLYRLSLSNGQVDREVRVTNVKNIDWECITADDDFIYLGDIGNNLGARKNLAIYKVPKREFIGDNSENSEVTAQKIFFSYPEQVEFPRSYKHNFDAESLISKGDSLYIFTKNWLNRKTSLYGLPKEPGTWRAKYKGEFNSEGLITDAAFEEDGNRLVLLGYNYSKEIHPFIWTFTEIDGDDFFDGEAQRFDIVLNRQAEGICFYANGSLLLSTERGVRRRASLYRVEIQGE